jgi:hypothetical protein
MTKAKDLQIVRFTQSAMCSIIPPQLFAQIVDADPQVNLETLIRVCGDCLATPFTYFFAFLDPAKNQVVGFLWCTHNVLRNRLVVSYMSILPEYQRHGIFPRFFELCKGVVDRLKLDPILDLYSLHPPIAERYGGIQSKTRIYEFDTMAADFGTPRRKDDNDVAETEATQ